MQFVNLAEVAENNKRMLERYPFIWPSRDGQRLSVPEFNYTTTVMDTMPRGYLISFGERFLEDVRSCLEKEDALGSFLILRFSTGWGSLRVCGNSIVRGLRDVLDVYEYMSERVCSECGKEARFLGVTFEGSTKGHGVLPHCDECRDRILLDEISRGFSPMKFEQITLPEWIRETDGGMETFDGVRWTPLSGFAEIAVSGVDVGDSV